MTFPQLKVLSTIMVVVSPLELGLLTVVVVVHKE